MIYIICPNCGRCGTPNPGSEIPTNCKFCETKHILEEYPNDVPSAEIENLVYEKYIAGDPAKEILNKKQHEEIERMLAPLRDRLNKEIENRNNPRCPRCGSTAITTGARGYSLFSGFIGSGKTTNRCGNCGYKWYPKR